jgi:polar amino acid transport system substrate-binding protein
MRRRWPLALALSILLVAVLVWLILGALPEEEDETWEQIQETKVLKVCTDPSWPPFEFLAGTGEIEGLDAELAQLLAERLVPGGKAAMVTVGFDSLYDALLAGRCDAVLSALPYDPTLTEDVAYSEAYINSGLVLVVDERSTGIQAVTDLPGHAVGVEWGFVPEGKRRQRLLLGSLELHRYDTAWDALAALQSGAEEAVIVDRISALGYSRECGGIRLSEQPITEVSYVIPVRPDSVRLVKEINRVLCDLRSEGTLADLERKWF